MSHPKCHFLSIYNHEFRNKKSFFSSKLPLMTCLSVHLHQRARHCQSLPTSLQHTTCITTISSSSSSHADITNSFIQFTTLCVVTNRGGDSWTLTSVMSRISSRTSALLWLSQMCSRTMRNWWNSSRLWGICFSIQALPGGLVTTTITTSLKHCGVNSSTIIIIKHHYCQQFLQFMCWY